MQDGVWMLKGYPREETSCITVEAEASEAKDDELNDLITHQPVNPDSQVRRFFHNLPFLFREIYIALASVANAAIRVLPKVDRIGELLSRPPTTFHQLWEAVSLRSRRAR